MQHMMVSKEAPDKRPVSRSLGTPYSTTQVEGRGMGSLFSSPQQGAVASKRTHDELTDGSNVEVTKRQRGLFVTSTFDPSGNGTRAGFDSDAPAPPGFDTANKPLSRLKRRKVAMWLAYSGARYFGMQMNHGVATIEGELLAALVRCELLPDASRETLNNVQFSRAARTDKGVSAACQCVSLRIPCEFNGQLDPRVVEAINRELPQDIVVLEIVRGTNSFSARKDCYRRLYEYVIPVQVLGGANGVEKHADGCGEGDARVARLNQILAKYIGTHCFANFTEGFKATDPASRRYIIRIEASEPFRPAGTDHYFSAIQLYGQSFVIYQIRKMVGLALAVYSGVVPMEVVEVALSPHVRLITPTAPPLGLLLESVDFNPYNKQTKKRQRLPISVEGDLVFSKDRFKMDVIYREIAAKEVETCALADWVESVDKSRYNVDEIMSQYERFCRTSVGVEEARKREVADQFQVTDNREEFFGVYGPEEQKRLDKLLMAFEEKTGLAPKFVARAPGRVNLIGEHCDYNDFGVIGSATRQGTYIVASQSLDPRVSVMHMDGESYGPGSFSTTGKAVEEDSERSSWVRYVSWGWTAMIEKIISRKTSRGSGARILVDGDLPQAAGLGSSSSLVTASAMAAARLNRTRRGREELALIAAEGERIGAGTRGGAVDHTVSMCGIKDSAVYVSFSPSLETVTVPLPTAASFVVVNSGVDAHKGEDDATKMLFNTRVVESRLAAALVARRLKTHLSMTVSTPGQLYNMEVAGNQSQNLQDLVERVASVLDTNEEMTLGDAAVELGLATNSAEWKKRFLLGIEFGLETRLKLGQRMAHVLSEAMRVDAFKTLLHTPVSGGVNGSVSNSTTVISQLGEILSASHDSLRDSYECSCTEVDELVEFCLQRGSVGSRITGAGWGGCVLSLVPNQLLTEFVDALRARVGQAAVFVLEPSRGACVLAV